MSMESQIFNSTTSTAALAKQSCRLHLKAMRRSISSARRQAATSFANQTLWNRCKGFRFILSYASFGSELSLDPLNGCLAQEGRLVLPKMKGEKLQLFLVEDLHGLEPNSLGIREPSKQNAKLIDPSLVTLALIPGLGFDPETKHRLGYGKGVYDRLLNQFPSLVAWGIGFHEQVFYSLPSEAHDRSLTTLCLV
ncbi:5-formyltetrahydrofolate cyclo-ligase [Candidatus Protochlamydia naegleriophila]|nr:5-formyltetrahydrofolate cyclo-ligase [Candidatus Protochlamydia naegleriophila]